MNIQVVTSLYPSPQRPYEGVFVEQRWQRMLARGHRVSILHPQPYAPPLVRGKYAEIRAMPQQENRAGIAVQRPRYLHWPGRSRGNAARFATAAWSRLQDAAEVVVCDYAWPAAALAPRLAESGRACLICGRGSDVLEVANEAGLGKELGRYLAAAGAWCAVSQDLATAMDSLAGQAGVGRLVPNGVDTQLFHPASRSEARTELALDPTIPIVLVVGHLIARKDPLLALEVFARGASVQAELYYIGRGPMSLDLQAAIAARGLAARVHLLGERAPAELARWYAACDLVLLTSRREGRPNVVIEALACGRPVLATRAGGTAEVLSEPEMLGTSGAVAELSEKLARLMARRHDPALLAQSVAHLSWDASMSALEAALAQACAVQRSRS